jgi:N-acetyl-gamma-glutamyl-phosphate reductase
MTKSLAGRDVSDGHDDPATARQAAASMAHLSGSSLAYPCDPRNSEGSSCRYAKFCEVLHILTRICITILMTVVHSVGVLGASGYAGAELLRLLARHPAMEVAWAAGDQAAGQPLAARYPGLRAAYGELAFCSLDEGLDKGADVLFCALPHGRTAQLAARALGAAGLVVDLSADFRLRDPGAYPVWYGAEHPLPDQLGAWPYGLPELHREELRGAGRVAVPGCYPTAALLALAPLVAAGLVATEGIVVDAKSGLSGAGRSLSDANLFAQANENVGPYKVGSHRHTPEIEQELALAAGAPVTVTFTPHLVPATRGILATCYATLAPSAGDEELAACYAAAYGDEPFVDLLTPAAGWPSTRAVATTNRVQVAAAADRRSGRVVAAAAIDNLVKGAAGQAVQCANLALGLPETAGLDLVPPPP